MSDYGKFYAICDTEYRNYYYFALMANHTHKSKKYAVDYVNDLQFYLRKIEIILYVNQAKILCKSF